MKAVRSLSEPPADMQILPSKSLACTPWRPPTSWQMGTVTRVRARDGPDIDKDVEKKLEQDHARALPRVQHEVGDLLAAREASHPGEHVPDLDKRVVPKLRPQREHPLPALGVVSGFVDGASTERSGSCTLRPQVDSLWQTGHSRRSHGVTGVSSMRSLRFMPVSKISFESVVAGSEGTMARVTGSPQLEW